MTPRRPSYPAAFLVDGKVSIPTPHEPDFTPPPVDVVEDADGWRLVFEVPGASPDTVTVEVKERFVILRGVRPATERGSGRFLRLERATGPYERALELPEDADAERTSAYFQDGLLVLSVPKRASERGRNIPIRRGTEETP
jgi:HSP20 family protein